MNQKCTTWATLAASIFACGALSTNTQAQTSDAALNALVKKGILSEAEAKQAIADLEKEKPKTAPYVFPWGKESKLVLGGFLQGNGEFINPDAWRGKFSLQPSPGNSGTVPPGVNRPNGVAPTHERFRLRRARINVSGDFLENFDFKFEGDFAQGDGLNNSRTAFSGTDIFLNYHQVPELNIKFGQFKAPFGLEQLTPDTTLFTAERSQPTEALTPERQIGLQLWGKPLAHLVSPAHSDLLEYSVGIFNGNNRNITINDDQTFMYAGRISSTLFKGKIFDQDVKLRLGVNGFTSHYAPGVQVSQTGNLLMVRRGNPLTNPLDPLDGSLTGFASTNKTESLAWGVDESFTFGPFDIVAEYLEQRVRPIHATSTVVDVSKFTANGYYAQGSYYLPGRKVQLVAKWESFNPGQDPGHHDDIRSITGGINYYVKGDNLKLMLDYIHTWSQFRHENKGNPLLLPPGTKDQFDLVLARLQVMF